MGILDAFDSPEFLSHVLGIGSGEPQQAQDARTIGAMRVTNAVQRPPLNDFVPPMPPQVAPDFGPSGTDPNAAKPDFVGPTMNPGPLGMQGIGSDAGRTPGTPQPSWQNAQASGAPAPIPPIGISNEPAPIPPAPPPGSAPPTMGGGGLPAAFGLDPNRLAQIQAQQKLRANMAGIGQGLTAVGHLPAGASKGQALAAGAGGSLSGMAATEQKQDDTLFNQSSTAFKDMLAAKASDDLAGYRAAQGKYLAARAESLRAMTQQGGSKAYQNTPEFKVLRVEEDAAKWEKGQQIMLQKRWQLNGSTPEQQQQDLDNLAKKVEQFKNNLYKTSGIDPKQAEKLKTAGQEKDNPFDTKGMSLDAFHALVPMGAWYKDQNGVVRQRTVPPPGATPPQPLTPAQQDELNRNGRVQTGGVPLADNAPNLDDQAAMSGEAA